MLTVRWMRYQKRHKRTNPEGVDTFDTGTPNTQISSSGDSANLLEAITLLQKALAVHGAGGSGQADTTVILSDPDTNTGSTYYEYLSEILQDLKNMKKEDLLSMKILQKFFKTL